MGRTEETESGVQLRGGLTNMITDKEYCLLSYDTERYQRFGESYCLYLRERRLAGTGIFEDIVPLYQTTRRHVTNFSYGVQLLIILMFYFGKLPLFFVFNSLF
jgi:hypothetical protein